MNRTPWQLWDLQTGEPADGADTLEAIDGAGAGDLRPTPEHAIPGLLHIYLHLMEMSPDPGDARCRPRTGCAASCPTPATCCTCPRISTCCAATTGAVVTANERGDRRRREVPASARAR